MLKRLIGKPVLWDKLGPKLPAQVSEWIAEDTKRAQERKRRRAEKKENSR